MRAGSTPTRSRDIALAAVLALGLTAAPTLAQSGRPMTVAVSADTVGMGEIFELRVSIPVPSGSLVYFPDTLPATVNMESAGPVQADSEATTDGGARLRLTYPMIAFGAGTLPVPGLDVLIGRAGDTAQGALDAAVLPGGSIVGSWSDAPLRTGSADLIRVPRQAVWVVPVFTPQDLVQGIEPRPPNDVVGGTWNWPSLGFALLFSSVLAVALVSTTREWLAHGSGSLAHEDPTLDVLRQRALLQLDDLLAEGLHTQGRMLEFYTRSSGIVRSYVEAMDHEWASSLTSRELMLRLRSRSGDMAAGGLPGELGTAEIVKFGRLRPAHEAAETHWRALRDWVGASEGWAG